MIIQKEKGLDSFSVKTYEDIPKAIADELGLPGSLVNEAIRGFYADLRTVISNGEATKIHLRRFGTIRCTIFGVNKQLSLWLQAYKEQKITREVASLRVGELWKIKQLFYGE